MMCLPASLGALRSGASSVGFVAASGASYITSGTSINTPSTPAGVMTGDGLFAVVMHRSALTPPAGWTLVESQAFSGGGFDQTLSIYRRDSAASGDSSTAFTWSQSSANRMGLAYLLARSTSGTLSVAEALKRSDSATGSGGSVNAPCPTATAAGDGELLLLAASSIIVDTSGNTTWTPPSGATLRTTASLAQNRLAVATQARNSGQSNASPFTFTLTSGTVYTGAIALRLAAA